MCAVPIYEAKVNNENQVLLHAVKQDGPQGLDCHTDEKSRYPRLGNKEKLFTAKHSTVKILSNYLRTIFQFTVTLS